MKQDEIKRKILDKFKEYNRIIVSRHSRPDGDAVGSTMGLCEILRLTYPEKEIYLVNEDHADYLAFMNEESDEIDDSLYADALLVVLDTATAERISNTKVTLAKEVIKIDHHIETDPYGDLAWVEEDRSSICEMIADFYSSFRDELTINKKAATCIYCGMVTDSGRFRYEAVTGRTMHCAGELLDVGIDTDTLFAQLYMNDFRNVKARARLTSKVKTTENGVAYLYLSRGTQKRFGLTLEEASNTVSLMDSIKGSLIWLAFIENTDGSIRVRLRSRFVTVNSIAEQYHGGGHACASGATVYSKKEMRALLRDADGVLRDYKQTNEGWL